MKAYGSDLDGFMLWCKDNSVDPNEDYESAAGQYLTENRDEWAAKTVQRKLGTLRVFGRWLGLDDPLADYSAPTPPRPVPHPLPGGVQSVLAMAAHANGDDQRALVALCGLCGLRVSEALNVDPADIDYEHRELTVQGKGDRGRTIPIGDKAWELIAPVVGEAVLNGTKLVDMSNRNARRIITRLGRVAGIPRRVSSHDLRATYGTEAYNRTGNLRAVQELLGHTSSSQTEVYTGVTMEQMRKAGNLG